MKYVVVARNPEESLVSFKLFLDQHTDAFYDLWKVPRAAMTRPDFPTFYREVVDPRGIAGMFFGFIASWWPLRHEKNVLFMHFADMKRDLAVFHPQGRRLSRHQAERRTSAGVESTSMSSSTG